MSNETYTFQEFYIRPHMLTDLKKYCEEGREVGDFLRNVISNNLSGAVGHADSGNMRNIPAYSAYLYNEAPAACHGSPTKYNYWVKSRAGTIDLKEVSDDG